MSSSSSWFGDDSSQDNDDISPEISSWPTPKASLVTQSRPLPRPSIVTAHSCPSEVSYTVAMYGTMYKLHHVVTSRKEYYEISLTRENLHLVVNMAANDAELPIQRTYHVTYNSLDYTIFDDSGLDKCFYILDHESHWHELMPKSTGGQQTERVDQATNAFSMSSCQNLQILEIQRTSVAALHKS